MCIFKRVKNIFQLFSHDAAVDVCDVVLSVDSDIDERVVHSDQQYAGMGTMDYHVESLALFYGSDADGISQRERVL